MRKLRTLAVSCVLVVGMLAATPCGGGTTDTTCSPVCNGEQTGCAQLGNNLSALDALHAGNDLAKAIVGGTPTWFGAIVGVRITRQGLPSQEPQITNVLGKEVKVYTSGWVFKFCNGTSAVVFGAGPEVSTVQEECQTANCALVTAIVEPKLDAAAAIAAAFPSDSSSELYALNFMPAATKNQRIWTIAKNSTSVIVKVDADTGAIVP